MGSPHIRRAAVAAVAALLVVGLAACDDEPEVERDPDASASGTPIPPETSSASNPSPTEPTEPTLPPEAEEETKAGAEAFVEFYWVTVNYAQQTGDLDLLRSLSIPGCGGCNGGIESIERIYKRGGRITGGQHRVMSAAVIQPPSQSWAADVVVRVGRQTISGAGDLDQTSAAGRLALLFGLEHRGGTWLVTSLTPAS
jgi:hypothetical protein